MPGSHTSYPIKPSAPRDFRVRWGLIVGQTPPDRPSGPVDEDRGSSEPILRTAIGRKWGIQPFLRSLYPSREDASWTPLGVRIPNSRAARSGDAGAASRSGLWHLERICGASVVVSARGTVLGPPFRDSPSRTDGPLPDLSGPMSGSASLSRESVGRSIEDKISSFQPHSLEYAKYPRSRDLNLDWESVNS